MKKYLLRFRDTGDLNTIQEHEKLFDTYGYTWWGWWKKDSEPERLELFRKIEKNFTQNIFFLFDRSTERFFQINVDEIKYSDNKINTPEFEKTPSYYNNEKLFLWLKINSIKEILIEDFLKNFTIVPSNDFTFFTEDDIFQEYSELSKANFRIDLESDYILHLSDIHFGEDFGFPATSVPGKRPLLDIITDFVKHDLRQEIGLLVISGDISSRGDGNILLNQGLPFLEDLCNNLGIRKECVIIIPGNHDIPLQSANFKDYNHENAFRIFLQQFYGEPMEPFGLNFYRFPCGRQVDILRINSVKLRKKEESNYGYVDWSHYKNLLALQTLDGDFRIAVIHHHLASMQAEEILSSDYPFGSISVTIDSGKVIEGLQRNGFDIVLNGHQHVPGITRITRGFISDSNHIDLSSRKELTILSAGSAGVKDARFSTEMKYNTFSLYQLKKNELLVEVKKFNPSLEPTRHFNSIIKI